MGISAGQLDQVMRDGAALLMRKPLTLTLFILITLACLWYLGQYFWWRYFK